MQNPVLAVSAAVTKSRATENHGKSLGIQEIIRKNPSHALASYTTVLASKTPLGTSFEDVYATPSLT